MDDELQRQFTKKAKTESISSLSHTASGPHRDWLQILSAGSYATAWIVTDPRQFSCKNSRGRLMWESVFVEHVNPDADPFCVFNPAEASSESDCERDKAMKFAQEGVSRVIEIVESLANKLPLLPLEGFLLPPGHPILAELETKLPDRGHSDAGSSKRRKVDDVSWLKLHKMIYTRHGVEWFEAGEEFVRLPHLEANPYYKALNRRQQTIVIYLEMQQRLGDDALEQTIDLHLLPAKAIAISSDGLLIYVASHALVCRFMFGQEIPHLDSLICLDSLQISMARNT